MTLAAAALSLVALFGLNALLPGIVQAQEEVPFVTTPDRVTLAMLELAGVTRHDRLIDLGSGDGRIVITAARRYGAQATGVEIVPDLVLRSRAAAESAGVASRVQFLEQDLFKTDLSSATVITMYLLPEVNLQLRPRLLALTPGTRLVSHDWDMGDWRPDRTVTLDVPEKKIGLDKRSRVHLWWVPAPVAGLWCGPDGRSLNLEQQFQAVHGSLSAGPTSSLVVGRIAGRDIELQSLNQQLRLQWQGPGELVQTSASGEKAERERTREQTRSRDQRWLAATAAGSCPARS